YEELGPPRVNNSQFGNGCREMRVVLPPVVGMSVYILGDLNCDSLKPDNESNIPTNYNDELYWLSQLIDDATCYSSISDHSLVFAIRKMSVIECGKNLNLMIRVKKINAKKKDVHLLALVEFLVDPSNGRSFMVFGSDARNFGPGHEYLEVCKEEEFEPLSRATLFRILEIREASQRKSLQGLDNTAADGSIAFMTMEEICERLVHFGVDMKWSQSVIKKLQKAKEYLKTDYKVHCQESESLCADHCRAFALNIGKRVGISVSGYDFSEPQQGKDICDRIISPLKSSIRKYCNEGHDILNATDMNTALNYHPVKGASSSVNEVNESVEQLKVKKIPNFSSYHNFIYEKDGIRVWRAFGVGVGKKVPSKTLYISHQGNTQMQIKDSFPGINSVRETKLKKKNPAEASTYNTELEGLFDCPEPGCNHVFKSFNCLELHMDVGQHSRFISNESVYDVLRREWANSFKTVTTKDVQASAQSADKLPHAEDTRGGR
ncbi:hypothetical protein AC249_AIPGENE16100, partial, partial [Paramuricea clavata]